MRNTAGSAAAPAARCRKCRRGSFNLNLPLPSHHSITSSASCCSCRGTSRPSALAVFRLMMSSKRVWLLDREIAWIGAFENFIHVGSAAPILVAKVRTIGDETSQIGEFSKAKYCGKSALQREVCEFFL